MKTDSSFQPANVHSKLGAAFFDPVEPAKFPRHILRYRNQRAAARIGLQSLPDDEWIDRFGRFKPIAGSVERPLALRYHGHQFRSYNPELGDGRGFLFAQVFELATGRLLDLGTKGSGETPWSRRGDGRLTLKGGVREVLATEMLEALGVETSKSFSLIETGEQLERHDEPSPTRSSVLVRLNHSNIRIGTFQRLAFHRDSENLIRLLDHTIEHYMPDLLPDLAENRSVESRAVAFVREVSRRNARLTAQWMAAGFVHGVLNSDNINVTGESFDYGPWRFVPTYNPNFVAAYYDEMGLYAFGRQPNAMAWNMARLAEALIPIADSQSLASALDNFGPTLQRAYASEVVRRLGLRPRGIDPDAALAATFTGFMLETQAPFERCYFDLYGGLARPLRLDRSPSSNVYASKSFEALRANLSLYQPRDAARLDHSYFEGEPCTMLIEDLESIWDAIASNNDWGPFNRKIEQIGLMRDAYCNDSQGAGLLPA